MQGEAASPVKDPAFPTWMPFAASAAAAGPPATSNADIDTASNIARFIFLSFFSGSIENGRSR
jgi:hypothetical protein